MTQTESKTDERMGAGEMPRVCTSQTTVTQYPERVSCRSGVMESGRPPRPDSLTTIARPQVQLTASMYMRLMGGRR